ncbi:MAG: hypothetical protein A2137_02405 [Chloroflexi bacterium RBG_16_58_8]|nr:MAG: hypothetical protein A2137_02405 [Chloroflexi bacterium RBG_16_58_8]
MMVIRTLKQCPVFATLNKAELEKVAALAVPRQYEAGATIFKGIGRSEELLLIEEGRVALQIDMVVTSPQATKRVTVDMVDKNELLGWSAFIEPDAYILTAVCLKNTRALAINSTGLRALMQEDCHIGYGFLNGLIKVVNSRLHETVRVLISERHFEQETTDGTRPS